MNSRPAEILFVFGTRPEAIKVAPVIRAFGADPRFRVRICVTAQHRELLDQVLEFFEIVPDTDLDLMQANQTPAVVFGRCLTGVTEELERSRPAIMFVQGDTTTAAAAALAGFLSKVPVGHIEAGLRSFQRYAPFPEEMNRRLAGDLADLHFAPVEAASKHLANEGIRENVFVVGNTVVDALLLGLKLIESRGDEAIRARLPSLEPGRRMMLVTIHRRESFGAAIEEVFRAVKEIANEHAIEVIYPVHPNPNVRKAVRILEGIPNVHLVEPLGYAEFIWLMAKATLILTDSGGVQEEAPSLGVPVLVAREVTERQEGVEAGCSILVGTNRERIVAAARSVLNTPKPLLAVGNPYGDGQASTRIVSETARFLAGRSS